ncbi:ribosome silencing factor [Agaribacterium haliotis]|uniref:ribosome silencing factor n=1 Tax=Agaribacterium haliotis TaxID=2013869 RepID=UPI000BB58161|nr:ribosome silencing factor [Agaribacterium haliotis]
MPNSLQAVVEDALDDLKAQDVTVLDVRELSDVMDTLVIATGTSSRHVKSLASNVVEDCKKAGFRPLGYEGLDEGEWALVDLGEMVVHVMQQSARDLYELEKLWSLEPATRKNEE